MSLHPADAFAAPRFKLDDASPVLAFDDAFPHPPHDPNDFIFGPFDDDGLGLDPVYAPHAPAPAYDPLFAYHSPSSPPFDSAGLYPRLPSIASSPPHHDFRSRPFIPLDDHAFHPDAPFKNDLDESNYYLARWSTVADPAASDSPPFHPASLPVAIPIPHQQPPFVPYVGHSSFQSDYAPHSPRSFAASLSPPQPAFFSPRPLPPHDPSGPFAYSAPELAASASTGGRVAVEAGASYPQPGWASHLWGADGATGYGSGSRFPQGQALSAPRTAVPVLATATATADLSSPTADAAAAPFWPHSAAGATTLRGYPASAPSAGAAGPIRTRARRYSHRAGSEDRDREDAAATVRPRKKRVAEDDGEGPSSPPSRPRGESERRSESPGRASPPLKSTLRPPKLAPSTWQLYFTDWIQKHQLTNDKKLNVAQAAKEAGAEYAALSAEEKEPYKRRSQVAKEARERELSAWMSTLTPDDIKKENAFRAAQRKAGKSRRSNIKDPNAPKKPLSAYFMFLQRIRSDPVLVRDVFGDEQETTRQSVLAAARWRSMTDEERKPFLAQAEQEKLNYEEKRRMYEDGAPISYANISFSILPQTPAQLVAQHPFKLEHTFSAASESESDNPDHDRDHDVEAGTGTPSTRRRR